MKEVRMHRYVDTLKRQFAEGRIGRRDFPWSSTMLLPYSTCLAFGAAAVKP